MCNLKRKQDRGVTCTNCFTRTMCWFKPTAALSGDSTAATLCQLIFIMFNKQLKSCGHCTHSCGSGRMYSLVCTPIHPPKAMPSSCCVYQMGVKVQGEFHTFLCPLGKKQADQAGTQAEKVAQEQEHTVTLIQWKLILKTQPVSTGI